MKKLILIAAIAFVNIYNLSAQTSNNSIVVFTEGGEPFYLILNGIKQNSRAETNVKAAGLNTANYKAKVIFDQKGIPDCDKTIPMMWAAEPVSNTEFVFSVHKDKKGNYKWKFVSQGPISGSTYVSNNNAVTANTNTNSVIANTNTNTSDNGMNVNTNGGGGTNTNVTTTTNMTTSGNATGTGVNVNMGVNGTGLNMNVNVNDGTNMNTTATTTTTTSYTTSTSTNGVTNSSSGSNTQVNTNTGGGNVGINTNVTGTGINTNTSTNTNVNTNTNTTNTNSISGSQCGSPMNATEFAEAKKTISSKSFEDTKMTIAKQIADNNCLDVNEIKGMMGLFSFEETKLEFAKYCYANCYDKKNYYKMSDAFQFEASTDELNAYIKGK